MFWTMCQNNCVLNLKSELVNIFVLDKDPIVAQDACDKHIVKMILESSLKCYVRQKEY